MSNAMLLGVLRMPIPDNPAPLTLRQFVDRARQAAAEIERLTDDYAAATHLLTDRDAHIERLKAELATLLAATAAVQADQRAEIDRANAVIDELRADAERYRHLRQFTSAGRNTVGRQIFVLPYVSPAGLDLSHGSVAQHLDAAIDAARALRSRSKG